MSTGRTITWTREKYLLLVKQYEAAAAARKASFTLELPRGENIELDTGYARYLLEYLGPDFAAAPDQPRRPYNEGEEGQ